MFTLLGGVVEPLGGGTYLEELGLWVWDVRVVARPILSIAISLLLGW